MQLLDLPPELLIRILFCLEVPDLVSVLQVHSSFRSYQCTSKGLQYRFAAWASGVEDNSSSNLSAHDRLNLLKYREDGWSNLNIDFMTPIPFKHNSGGLYDLSGGVYMSGDPTRQMLHYCKLPSKADDPVSWSRINMEKEIVDFGLSIYEHDLIAILTISPSRQAQVGAKVLEIHLLQLSADKPHPLAHVPVIFVQDTTFGRPNVIIEIVGDNLALTITHRLGYHRACDYLYIFDWKTGKQKFELPAPNHTYSGVVFLSPSYILIPNMRHNSLDIWEIPPSQPTSADSSLVASLSLPDLAQNFIITSLTSRAEPNPMPSGTPYLDQLFLSTPTDAIVVFNISIEGIFFGEPQRYTVIVHRSALLRLSLYLAARKERKPESGVEAAGTHDLLREQEPPPTAPDSHIQTTPEGNVEIAPQATRVTEAADGDTDDPGDEDIGGVESDAEGEEDDYKGIEEGYGDAEGFYEDDEEEYEDDEEDYENEEDDEDTDGEVTEGHPSRREPFADQTESSFVPWEDWGPQLTRWFNADHSQTDWVTTAQGQRCLISEEVPDQPTELSATLFDFNPSTITHVLKDKATKEMTQEQEERLERTLVVTEPSLINDEVFAEPVSSALPYVSVDFGSGYKFEYDGIMMDEERLLGIKCRDDHTVSEIEVMHIGLGTSK